MQFQDVMRHMTQESRKPFAYVLIEAGPITGVRFWREVQGTVETCRWFSDSGVFRPEHTAWTTGLITTHADLQKDIAHGRITAF